MGIWVGGVCQNKFQENYPGEALPRGWKRRAAHSAVHSAVKQGKLTRGDCQFCGATEGIHGHHESYDRPLEVIWLCRVCHMRGHKSGRLSPG